MYVTKLNGNVESLKWDLTNAAYLILIINLDQILCLKNEKKIAKDSSEALVCHKRESETHFNHTQLIKNHKTYPLLTKK